MRARRWCSRGGQRLQHSAATPWWARTGARGAADSLWRAAQPRHVAALVGPPHAHGLPDVRPDRPAAHARRRTQSTLTRVAAGIQLSHSDNVTDVS
eukprot:173413-Prymnesium_polylepis.1